MESISVLIPALVAVVFGLGAGYAVSRVLDKNRLDSAKAQAEEIQKKAESEAESIKREALLQAKDRLLQAKTDLEETK